MPHHNTIRSERLDRRQGVPAKQTFKAVQLTLAFKNKPNDRSFDLGIAVPHRPGP